MKKAQGFTLVELLVVIVIMGILATGSVSMFTGAQQKARDAVRITDIQAVKLSLEQAYGDDAKYPQAIYDSDDDNNVIGLDVLLDNGYIDKLPEDPKHGQKIGNESEGGTYFVYLYGSKESADTGIIGQEFELSTTFENAGNKESKSEEDGGDDEWRWETGVNINDDSAESVPKDNGVNTTITYTGTKGTNDYSATISHDAYIIPNDTLNE